MSTVSVSEVQVNNLTLHRLQTYKGKVVPLQVELQCLRSLKAILDIQLLVLTASGLIGVCLSGTCY